MCGYWNNPEETARAFRDGLFRTGDGGYQDADASLSTRALQGFRTKLIPVNTTGNVPAAIN
jgi:long-subunit acyl-CoA synthetase (AMP-forming)